jgi:hypothetical protein
LAIKARVLVRRDEEQRLAEEQQGLEPEEPMDPVSGNILAFDGKTGDPAGGLARRRLLLRISAS